MYNYKQNSQLTVNYLLNNYNQEHLTLDATATAEIPFKMPNHIPVT